MAKHKFILLPLMALMLVMSVFIFTAPAYAADIPDQETLTVDAVWLEGDMLYISVTDHLTGTNQTLVLSLDEYAGNSEYVTVQAADRNGNLSNPIQFKNPFYVPPADGSAPQATQSPDGTGASAAPDGGFTFDGTGTVVDNVTEQNGKEFFSIQTEDGNVFYLIVDRQRNSENVYLLNAVTEEDLISLAKLGDGKSQSGIPNQTVPEQNSPPSQATSPEPEPAPAPAAGGGMGNGSIIFIIIGAIAVGGAGYYFKIVKPKKKAGISDDEDDYDEGDDSDYGEEDESAEDGDEE